MSLLGSNVLPFLAETSEFRGIFCGQSVMPGQFTFGCDAVRLRAGTSKLTDCLSGDSEQILEISIPKVGWQLPLPRYQYQENSPDL
jgi:hypothetical protein